MQPTLCVVTISNNIIATSGEIGNGPLEGGYKNQNTKEEYSTKYGWQGL